LEGRDVIVTTAQPYLVEPSAGEVLVEGPFGVVSKLAGKHSGGLISIVEHPIAPGVLIPPHVHLDVDEWSYVIEGRVGVRVGEDEFIADRGAYVLKPRAIQHTFWNPGPDPARLLEIITPAGFEGYFAELGEMLRTTGRDPERIKVLAARYGLVHSGDWVDDLESRHGVRLLGKP
jgi:mannose-6-phosphate isomerase-like protein (cupin superfamily)